MYFMCILLLLVRVSWLLHIFHLVGCKVEVGLGDDVVLAALLCVFICINFISLLVLFY